VSAGRYDAYTGEPTGLVLPSIESQVAWLQASLARVWRCPDCGSADSWAEVLMSCGECYVRESRTDWLSRPLPRYARP
jgi:hypothetical protein